MANTNTTDQRKKNNGANVGYEAELWQMADALQGSMDAAEYKHVVLGLIFLKYISDAFEEQYAKLEAEKAQGADPEDPDEYRALSIFWVPPEARWSRLKGQASSQRSVSSLTTRGQLCSRVFMGPFGSDIKTDNFIEVGVPVIRGGNLTDGFVDEEFVFVSEAEGQRTPPANAFPGDIVITHRGTLGQVGLIPKKSRYPRYVVSQSQMVLSVLSYVATPHFLFEYLCSSTGQNQLLANTSQTGVPAIARPTTSLKAIRLVSPPLDVLQSFEKRINAFVDRAIANGLECRTLSALRDSLLPKLLSGEVRAHECDFIPQPPENVSNA
jgi:HsdM N-terminal domain/Type I restriction modification DNA specificity domain